ncbi:hypothetical protein AMS68_007552 [Peltaster fructicola]|uniref:Mediator of RNA polymerase II transcription subunit 6 n=1 Tax=Peltaster fructicola TaxID=286661 RepID=A0A6H0Y550_9PEZI|nr:hypothetical protein AMS68_007552 [Peltaster fructicola]
MPDPLDEQQWQRPEIAQWYVQHGAEQGFPWATQYMHENMLHRYFSESIFFDFTSKNGMPIDQSATDPGAWALTHNRRDFEEWLSQREGVEYVIVDSKDGVHVIRKQDRKKASKDELTTLGTYFLIGENMYQAPSVADIVGNRLMTATTALSDFIEQALVLPQWTPVGYTYTRRAESPPRSREGSVQSVVEQPASHTKALTVLKTMQFADEFMDENPIQGEPGHFTFSSSTAAVKKRKADEEAVALKAKELAAKVPAALKSEKPVEKEKKKMSKSEKMKKRKSRANVQSPTKE